jgi:hypothetical protein
MTNSDYELMIRICHYALRKGYDLNQQQTQDIGNLLQKLYSIKNKGTSKNALVRSKKVGKTTGV